MEKQLFDKVTGRLMELKAYINEQKEKTQMIELYTISHIYPDMGKSWSTFPITWIVTAEAFIKILPDEFELIVDMTNLAIYLAKKYDKTDDLISSLLLQDDYLSDFVDYAEIITANIKEIYFLLENKGSELKKKDPIFYRVSVNYYKVLIDKLSKVMDIDDALKL